MELCSIEDAFPKILETSKRSSGPAPGCTDSKASKEERRAARKRAKQCKTLAYDYLNVQDGTAPPIETLPDPDRPAIKHLGEVSAFVSYEDAFPDISGSHEGFKVPPTTKPPSFNTGLPAYFGADEEGFTDTYPTSQVDLPGVELNPQTIEGGFDQKGVSKAGSTSRLLPVPSLNDSWKPLTEATGRTSYIAQTVERVEPSGDLPPTVSRPPPKKATIQPGFPEEFPPRKNAEPDTTRDALLMKVKDLTQRLEDLEKKHNRNSQTEVLMFVGTGLFLLISFDLIVRSGKN